MTACFNLLTINNVDTIYLLCDDIYKFNHSKIKCFNNIDELMTLILT